MNKNKKHKKLVPALRFSEFEGEWEIDVLSNCADVIDPHPSHRAPKSVGEGIPFIGIGDISESGVLNAKNVRLVSNEIYEEHINRYKLKAGDFAYGRVASVGKVVDLSSNVDKTYTYSPTMAIIQPKKIYATFLRLFCESNFFITQVKSKTTGSTRKSIGMQNLRILEIAIPNNLQEQQKIANTLTSLDTLIAAEKEKRDALRAHKKGLLQQLFPAKGERVPRVRFGEFRGKWEEKEVKDFLELLTDFEANGSFAEVKKNVSVLTEPDFAWYVRATDLENQSGLDKVKYVDEHSYNFLHKTKLFGGELLITKRGEIGKVYFFKPLNKLNATVAPNMYLLKMNKYAIPKFFYYYFTNFEGNQSLKRLNASSTIGALYKDDVKKLRVIIPSIPEQQKIAKALSSLDEKIAAQSDKIAALEAHKKGLMQQLFPNPTTRKG